MFKKTLETAKYTVKLSFPGLLYPFPALSLVLFLGCVAPHILQFIKTAIFGQHDVDYDIDIIDQNPLIGLPAFVFIGELIAALFHQFFYGIGYSLYLSGAGSFADDKEICYCFRYFSQIQGNNFLAFFLLDRFDDGFKNFRIPR